MSIYLALKPWFLAALIMGALYLFYKQVSTLLMLLKSVKGKTVAPLDAIKERIVVLITDVLGQRNVRRKFPTGLAHMGIFWVFWHLGLILWKCSSKGSLGIFHGVSFLVIYTRHIYSSPIFLR